MSFMQSCVPEVIVSLPCRRIMMMAYRLTQLTKTPTAILRQHHQLSSRLLVRALMREQECPESIRLRIILGKSATLLEVDAFS